jgi:membrane-associated phospholipid phosphatase
VFSTVKRIPPASRRLLLVAVLAFAVFLLIYLLAVQTEIGQRWDNAALATSENVPERVRDEANDALGIVSTGSLLLAGIGLGLILILRGRATLALVPLATIGASLVATEIFKLVIFTRPELALDPILNYNGYPSGHTSVAASIGLAAIVAAPRRLRALTALAAFALAAGGGVTVVIAAWHRPSDALGSFAITLAATAAVLAATYTWRPELVPRAPQRGEPGTSLLKRIELVGVVAGIGLFTAAIAAATLRYGAEIDWTKPDAAFLVSLAAIVAAAAILVGVMMRTLRVPISLASQGEVDPPPQRSRSDTVVAPS